MLPLTLSLPGYTLVRPDTSWDAAKIAKKEFTTKSFELNANNRAQERRGIKRGYINIITTKLQ